MSRIIPLTHIIEMYDWDEMVYRYTPTQRCKFMETENLNIKSFEFNLLIRISSNKHGILDYV